MNNQNLSPRASADRSVIDHMGQVADTEDCWHLSKANVVYYGKDF